MPIIVEGPDNSGKSTLAQYLVGGRSMFVQGSEGPPKYQGEMIKRIAKYSTFPITTIFDRHPAVSNPIYDEVRPVEERDIIPELVLNSFYRQNHLFIYCDPVDRDMSGHRTKPGDSDDHISRITENRTFINTLYRLWAIRHAHFIYRIGDDMKFIRQMATTWTWDQETKR